MRRRWIWFPLVALALVCASCSGSSTDPVSASAESSPRPDGSSTTTADDPAVEESRTFPEGWTPDPLAWTECAALPRGECAALAVPLDWAEPEGEQLELALGRLPATGERIGSLLTNPGGPGGSGLEYLGYSPFDTPVSERFDVVSWDPRGVGESSGLDCSSSVPDLTGADTDPDSPEEQAALEAAAEAIASECAAMHPDLLPHLDTVAVAFDLEAIRRALGDEPLNYVGYSYGTQIGLAYAERFAPQVRTMVLDGVVDPTQGFEEFLLAQTRAFDDAFRRDAQRCSEQPTQCQVDDLAAAYDEVLELVEDAPLPSNGDPVGPGDLATAAILTSYGGDGWSELGPALAAALDGDGDRLRDLADSYYDLAGYASYAAVVCTDSPVPEGSDEFAEFAERARQLSPRFGAAVANEMLPCATWAARSRTRPGPVSAPGAPPILVVGNTGDAATPYENAVAVAGMLDTGVLVTADIDGHTAYGWNRCVTDVVDAYLVELVVPEADPVCT